MLYRIKTIAVWQCDRRNLDRYLILSPARRYVPCLVLYPSTTKEPHSLPLARQTLKYLVTYKEVYGLCYLGFSM